MDIPRLSFNKTDKITGIPIIKQYSVKETYPIHSHDFFELFFVSKGKGTHCINGKSQLLECGSLVFIRPDDIHSFKALNYFDFEMFSIGFPEEELLDTLKYLDIPLSKIVSPQLPAHFVIHGNEKAFIEQQLEFMLVRNTKQERQKLFKVFLPLILYLLQELEIEKCETEIFPKWLENLDNEMSKRENYILGLPKMLEISMYSQEYLNRVFKRYFKITPTEYINSKRLIYASELLVEQKFNITEICFMTGFNNLSHFYSVFKKQYKCTPNQFLKKSRSDLSLLKL